MFFVIHVESEINDLKLTRKAQKIKENKNYQINTSAVGGVS